jgi:DNA-directed RNA polymerase specialized sigma24 family protein
MPDSYREMISLKDIDALSDEEIAVKTGQNINTQRVTLSRARALLREEYKKYFNEKRRT